MLKENTLGLEEILETVNSLPSAGGGLPEGWATGTFNTTSATMSGGFTVEHGLGAIPDVVVIFKEDPTLIGQSVRSAFRVNVGKDTDTETGETVSANSVQRCFYDNATGTGIIQAAGTGVYEDSDTTFTVPSLGTSAYYMPHLTYRWIAVRLGG